MMAIGARVALATACAVLLAGCGGAGAGGNDRQGVGPAQPAEGGLGSVPADSPLARCADERSHLPKPIDTSLARHFADDQVQSTILLDGGRFVASPPSGAPPVSATRARCNLLAGLTAENFPVLEAAESHGLSFGLGVVTVSPSVLRPGTRAYPVTQQRHADLTPFRQRLAWIAVIRPVVVTSCPAMVMTRSAQRPSSHPSGPIPPGYQVLALDARSGTAGVVYSARSGPLCGEGGVRPPSVLPLVEQVSEPWRLVHRTADDATISYARRSCDLPIDVRDIDTGRPEVSPEGRGHVVGVDVDRVVTGCPSRGRGRVLLRAQDPSRSLPNHLLHQRVGALDVTN